VVMLPETACKSRRFARRCRQDSAVPLKYQAFFEFPPLSQGFSPRFQGFFSPGGRSAVPFQASQRLAAGRSRLPEVFVPVRWRNTQLSH
jgi:hypothetical protein